MYKSNASYSSRLHHFWSFYLMSIIIFSHFIIPIFIYFFSKITNHLLTSQNYIDSIQLSHSQTFSLYFFDFMNNKVRRYQPFFLSPQHTRIIPTSPSKPNPYWKDKVNRQVTQCYEKIKKNHPRESKCSLPQNNQLHEVRSVNSLADCGAKSVSTQSNTMTPIKRKLKLESNHAESTILVKTAREKEIEIYYSQRVQLLEEECNYLRKKFIEHCLKHHKKEFQRLQ